MDTEIKALRATLSSYGMTKLSTANDVTDANSVALSAIVNNPTIPGSLANRLTTTEKLLDRVFNSFYYGKDSLDVYDKYIDEPGNITNHNCSFYCAIVHDSIGDSGYGGGTTFFFGYTYGYTTDHTPNGRCYDVQLRIKMDYTNMYIRCRGGTVWSDWKTFVGQ